MQKVDETINALCDWIQKELETPSSTTGSFEAAEMAKALAALVTARKRNEELTAIRKELQATRSGLELLKKDIVGTAVRDGVQKAVRSAYHSTGVKAEL